MTIQKRWYYGGLIFYSFVSCFPSFSDFLFFLSRQIVLNRPVVDEVFKFATGKTPIGCFKAVKRPHFV